ncbi:MFS transporter [Bifidobacterium tibiigranuli]|jgi:MFS family permease|uniref:MFS transporter n=1 Tax=Bifidobacterium tibiigranuli TaxID=2172043 RepID=UPI0026F159FF|nr:MFS transporter [Bifidobacterium tibiigranuli]MCI2185950.1 MFS transporter [Bifidobacterium tibiigranuli]MCI2204845.1 MFS transporter [Bifidobacterium tibiigranuli]
MNLGKRHPHGWGAYIAVISTLAVALAASGTPSPTYSDLTAAWRLSPAALTIAYAAYALGVVITLLTTGGISDRIGRVPVIIASMVVLALSLVCFVASNVAMLIVARLVQGLATGMLTGAASAALIQTHPHGDVNAAAAANSMTTSLSIAIGALLCGWILDAGGAIAIPYIVLLIATGVSIALVLVFLPWDARRSGAGLFAIQRLSIPSGMRAEFVLAALCVTNAWSVGGVYLALGGTLSRELLGIGGHIVTGIVIMAVQGVGAIVQFAWIRLHVALSERAMIIIAAISSAVGISLTAFGAVEALAVLAVIGALLSGVGFGLAFMAGTRIVSAAAPEKRKGEVIAAYFVVAYAAISVPAVFTGLLIGLLGVSAAFVTFAVIVCVLCIAIGLMLTAMRNRIGSDDLADSAES